MTIKLLSTDGFRDAAKDGTEPDATVFRFATGEPMNVDGAARTKRFVFSDATIDHAGDSIDPKGWDLSIFRQNPVALFSHASWEPPIGRASNVKVSNGKLVGDIEFATPDVYEFADTIFRLVDGGFLNAVSVGFKPKEWAFTADKERPYGIDFKKQTLLEISVCAVPCNPAALVEARGMGIDTAPLRDWAEKVLDSGDTVFLPRKELESLREKASDVPVTRYFIQASKDTPVPVAEVARNAVKRWLADPSEVPVLPEGLSLRAVTAAVVADPSISTSLPDDDDAAPEAKDGRRLSAKTKAALQVALDYHHKAMDQHEAAAQCIRDIMNDGATDDDGPDPEPDMDPDDVSKNGNPAENNLTPEQRRLKEVRALRSTLPIND